MMNNLIWYGGLSLSRFVEASGREPTTAHLLVAAFLASQKEGVRLQEMTKLLKEISTYDPAAHLDHAEILKQLGY